MKFKCCPEDDYRVFFGGYDLALDYNSDYICFWVYAESGAEFTKWFFEANQVQDSIEYENAGASFALISDNAVGGFKYDEWNLIQLPLSALEKHNADDSITMTHLRMVPATSGGTVTMYFDNIYVCGAEQAKAAAAEYRAMYPSIPWVGIAIGVAVAALAATATVATVVIIKKRGKTEKAEYYCRFDMRKI